MRTDELINTLVADHAVQPRPKPVAHGLVMAIIGGLAISLALFSLTLGLRPDILSALSTWRFDLKLGDNLVLVIAATSVALRLSSPTTMSMFGRLVGRHALRWPSVTFQTKMPADRAAQLNCISDCPTSWKKGDTSPLSSRSMASSTNTLRLGRGRHVGGVFYWFSLISQSC
jgi:Negative regulator of sigma F